LFCYQKEVISASTRQSFASDSFLLLNTSPVSTMIVLDWKSIPAVCLEVLMRKEPLSRIGGDFSASR